MQPILITVLEAVETHDRTAISVQSMFYYFTLSFSLIIWSYCFSNIETQDGSFAVLDEVRCIIKLIPTQPE